MSGSLVHDLWDLFSSKKGYQLYPDVLPFFKYLSSLRKQNEAPRLTTGIITNADNRVPGILSSLGLWINSKRHEVRNNQSDSPQTDVDFDIDFITMSYDTGTEKPSPRIFEAASRLSGIGTIEASQCIHVGDGLIADYYGAVKAGWHGVLLSRDKEETPPADLRLLTQETMTSSGESAPPEKDIPCIRDLLGLKALLSPTDLT
ncbi:MAG: hypothetical protein Q9164_003088 [Protoblastenia rupestris]